MKSNLNALSIFCIIIVIWPMEFATRNQMFFFSDRPLLWLRWFPPSPYREYLTWSNDKHRINSRRDGHVHFEWAILFLWKDYSSVKCTVPILSCVLFFIQLLRACLHVFISIIKPGVNKKDMLGASKYTEALLYTFTTCIARLSR